MDIKPPSLAPAEAADMLRVIAWLEAEVEAGRCTALVVAAILPGEKLTTREAPP